MGENKEIKKKKTFSHPWPLTKCVQLPVHFSDTNTCVHSETVNKKGSRVSGFF